MSWTAGNSNSATNGSGSSTSQAVTLAVHAGDLIGVWVGWFNPGYTIVVADATNGSYTAIGQSNYSNYAGGLWWVVAATTTTLTITATSSVATQISIAVANFSPAAGATIVAGNHSFNVSSTSPVSSGNAAFSGPGNWLAFGGGSANANTAPTISPLTTLSSVGSATVTIVAGYTANLTSSSSPQSASIADSGATRLVAGIVMFQEVPSAGGLLLWRIARDDGRSRTRLLGD
jgi:hypothetical protein